MAKLTINEPFKAQGKHSSVTVTSETIAVDLDERKLAAKPAAAIVAAIKRGIGSVIARAESGKQRWNRTGRLRDGIKTMLRGDRYDITAPADRLQFDGAASQLAEDVAAVREPLAQPEVQKAIEETAAQMHTKARR